MPPPDGHFVDAEFPPINISITRNANPDDHFENVCEIIRHGVTWRRGSELASKLFHEVNPNDIMQGYVGNCWLLAGIAAIAEFPERVQSLFQEKEISKAGKYHIRIFDTVTRQWSWIVVDDYLPLVLLNGEWKPLGAQPTNGELWVPLLEKACAKWFGSYAKTNGGLATEALMILTQGICIAFSQQQVPQSIAYNAGKFQMMSSKMRNARDRNSFFTTPMSTVCPEQLFGDLLRADQQNFLMVAWSMKNPPPDAIKGYGPSGEPISNDGIVKGHAYSLIAVESIVADGHLWRIVQIRNPWGPRAGAEWNGALSDRWPGWAGLPELKKALDFKESNDWLDGMFYMSWDDFLRRFSDIGVVYEPQHDHKPKLGKCTGKLGQTIRSGSSHQSGKSSQSTVLAMQNPQNTESPTKVRAPTETTVVITGPVVTQDPTITPPTTGSDGVAKAFWDDILKERSPCEPDPGPSPPPESEPSSKRGNQRKLPPKPKFPPPYQADTPQVRVTPQGASTPQGVSTPRGASMPRGVNTPRGADTPRGMGETPRDGASRMTSCITSFLSTDGEDEPVVVVAQVPSPTGQRARHVAALAEDLRQKEGRRSVLADVAKLLLAGGL